MADSAEKIVGHKELSIKAVREAIEALTDAQLIRLQKYASFAASRHDLRDAGIDATDLLNEAVLLVLSGKRIWYSQCEISFDQFLMGIIKSLMSHEADKMQVRRNVAAIYHNELPRPSSFPSPDQVLEATQILAQIQSMLAGDRLARLYIMARAEGVPFSEMPAMLYLAKKEIDAARKRVTRKLRKTFKGDLNYDS